MLNYSFRRLGALIIALGITACGGPIVHNLAPLPGMEDSVPEITEATNIVFETTAGQIRISVYPEAAPNAAQRFTELVESGYYDNTPIFRIVPGFVAQFGINWREPHNDWQNRNFNDDPSLFALDRGTLAFAKAGPNTNSTQVFISYAENNRLAGQAFSTFGMIVDGLDIIDEFVQAGELDQPRLWSNGETYIESLELKPTMIESARVD
jgi:peptidyl-prolyl cis-trans isomerase A (cyclophilin A)